jgi:hypothetical protein
MIIVRDEREKQSPSTEMIITIYQTPSFVLLHSCLQAFKPRALITFGFMFEGAADEAMKIHGVRKVQMVTSNVVPLDDVCITNALQTADIMRLNRRFLSKISLEEATQYYQLLIFHPGFRHPRRLGTGPTVTQLVQPGRRALLVFCLVFRRQSFYHRVQFVVDQISPVSLR